MVDGEAAEIDKLDNMPAGEARASILEEMVGGFVGTYLVEPWPVARRTAVQGAMAPAMRPRTNNSGGMSIIPASSGFWTREGWLISDGLHGAAIRHRAKGRDLHSPEGMR